jgi:hypothetical protein
VLAKKNVKIRIFAFVYVTVVCLLLQMLAKQKFLYKKLLPNLFLILRQKNLLSFVFEIQS